MLSAAPLNIGIDARPLLEPAGGFRRHLESLLPSLYEATPGARWHLFAPAEVDPGALPPPDRGRLVIVRGSLQAWLRRPWEEWRLPHALAGEGVDVLFSPYGAVPRRSPVPVVAMIHDLHFMDEPQAMPWGHRRYWRAVAEGAPRAARILTPSDAVRRDVVARLGLPPERVVVTPHGVAAPFIAAARAEDVDPFILAFGPWIPRKNLELLEEATRGLVDREGRPVRLIVTGAAPKRPRGSHVSILGAIPDEAVADRMRRAMLCCVPSIHEGFGLPALEAMACGSPVVVSCGGALPEVVGDAGVVVTSRDPGEWRRALGRLVSDPAERSRLGEAGRARSLRFSWEKTARLVADALRTAAGRS